MEQPEVEDEDEYEYEYDENETEVGTALNRCVFIASPG
jgi:hypothetical protein